MQANNLEVFDYWTRIFDGILGRIRISLKQMQFRKKCQKFSVFFVSVYIVAEAQLKATVRL